MAESWLKVVHPQPDADSVARTGGPGKADAALGPADRETEVLAGAPAVPERYRAGDLQVDVSAGVVMRGAETLELSPLTFALLAALVRQAPNIVRRQDLLTTVWPEEFVNDDTLSQRVRMLREALGDVAEERRYVASVRGWGYRIVPPVARLEEQVQAIRSLAVLPLANLTGDPEQEYFADGMTETLILALARIHSLKVISRTSVMRYKHANRRLPQIARELSVDAVVEGTVLAAAGRVRVSVQLIRAATDEHLWSECYDRPLEDVFALHSDLARSMAREIRAVVSPEEQDRLERRRRVDPVAHESELRGRYFLARFTPPDLERAIAWFEQAVARDASFAEALSGLAHASFERAGPLGVDLTVSRQRELLSRAKTGAQQALSIDPTLAEAQGVLGVVRLFLDWDWDGAAVALENALELDSNSCYAHAFRAVLASTTLDVARTLDEMRRALELDPLNLLVRAEAGECCYWVREYGQARAYVSETLELDPSFTRAHFVLGRLHENEGRLTDAIDEYEKAGLIEPGARAARQALRRGGPAGYHRWVLRSSAMGGLVAQGNQCERPFYQARTHARLGDADAAILCLERSYEQRDGLLALLKAQDWWDAIRTDARFADLVRRVGIP